MSDPQTLARRLAARTDNLEQSDIRALTAQINATGGINLGQGICDLPTPTPIREAAKRAIDAGKSIYTSYAGIRPLREAILEKSRTYNDLPVTSPNEVMVAAGSTGAFTVALFALLDPGDEVLLFEPFYGYHRGLLEMMGAVPRYVPTRAPDRAVNFDAVEAALTPRTKAVVLNTPCNPSGKVWTRAELERLLTLLQKHDCYAITDEIYEYMVYGDYRHVSLGSLPGAYERTITISGFSKTYNMTGWRLGYAVAPKPLIEKMGLLNDLIYICAPAPLQHGVLAAFDELGDIYLTDMQADYAKKRRLLCETLERIGFDVPWPQGAYYIFADFESLSEARAGFEDDTVAADTLIREAGVAAVPGHSFFEDPKDGRYRLRFCFAKEMEELQQACDQLEATFG